MAKKKDETGPNGAPVPHLVERLKSVLTLTLQDDEAFKRWPNLVEMMAPRYKDGALVRQEGNLRLTVRSGRWYVTLECPSERVKCTYSNVSLASLWDGLEAALTSDGVIWEETYKKRQKDLNRLEKPLS